MGDKVNKNWCNHSGGYQPSPYGPSPYGPILPPPDRKKKKKKKYKYGFMDEKARLLCFYNYKEDFEASLIEHCIFEGIELQKISGKRFKAKALENVYKIATDGYDESVVKLKYRSETKIKIKAKLVFEGSNYIKIYY